MLPYDADWTWLELKLLTSALCIPDPLCPVAVANIGAILVLCSE